MIPLASSIMLCLQNQVIRFNFSLEQLEKWSIDGNNTNNSELVRCAVVDRFVYECVQGNDKKYRLSVRDSGTKKIISYSVLE